MLGLQTTKNMNIECLTVYGDPELVIRQIKNQCQAKNPRLRTYRNEVWDLIENLFLDFNIQFLPREGNRMGDSLAIVASTFRPTQNPLLKYQVEVRCRPSIPNNIKHWQMFEDDEQVKLFIEVIGEFSNSTIDQEEGHGFPKSHRKVQQKDQVLPHVAKRPPFSSLLKDLENHGWVMRLMDA